MIRVTIEVDGFPATIKVEEERHHRYAIAGGVAQDIKAAAERAVARALAAVQA